MHRTVKQHVPVSRHRYVLFTVLFILPPSYTVYCAGTVHTEVFGVYTYEPLAFGISALLQKFGVHCIGTMILFR